MNYTNGGGYDDSDDDDSNPLEDLEALGEKEERREKELEEQAKEEEEGLEAARELARQGRDETSRSTGGLEEHAETTMADAALEGRSNGASESVDGSKINGAHTTPLSSTELLDKPGSGGSEDAVAAPPASSDAAFVSLPPQTEQLPAYSGFHAVNGAAAGGAWRATTTS